MQAIQTNAIVTCMDAPPGDLVVVPWPAVPDTLIVSRQRDSRPNMHLPPDTFTQPLVTDPTYKAPKTTQMANAAREGQQASMLATCPSPLACFAAGVLLRPEPPQHHLHQQQPGAEARSARSRRQLGLAPRCPWPVHLRPAGLLTGPGRRPGQRCCWRHHSRRQLAHLHDKDGSVAEQCTTEGSKVQWMME